MKKHKLGDLFTDDQDTYLLCKIPFGFNDKYVCINLSDGKAWDTPKFLITNAIEGLEPLDYNQKIRIVTV